MNILYIADHFHPETNAGAIQVHECAASWVAAGHNVTVITTCPNFPAGKVYMGHRNALYEKSMVDGITVWRVWSFVWPNRGVLLRTLDFLSFFITGTIAGLLLPKPDVVIAMSPPLFAGMAGSLIAKLRRVPFVFQIADVWPASVVALGVMKRNLGIRMFEKIAHAMYNQASMNIAATDGVHQHLSREGIDARKIITIKNGANLSLFSPKPKDPELLAQLGLQDKQVIGHIGTMGEAADFLSFMDIIRRSAQNPKLHFLFVGNGIQKARMLAYQREHGLTNISIVDAVPRTIVARYWSICDLCLLHLRAEAFFEGTVPCKSFEAMAMGIPIFYVGPVGEMSAMIASEGIGWCVTSGQPEEVLQALNKTVDHDHAEHRLTQQNAIACAEGHSRAKQAEAILGVLENVCHPSLRSE